MEQENREAIIRIEGKLELLDQKLTTLKDNHLCHIEKSEDIPSYTFDTLTKLNHDKDNLYFILGSDTAMNIRTWNNYEKLSELTNFLIALRKSIESL